MPSSPTNKGADLLSGLARQFVREARRAILATLDDQGRPRLVPICFVLEDAAGSPPSLWTPIDEKPKRMSDPMRLARVRDVMARPGVDVLLDRWDEDWSKLGWLRLGGRGDVLERPPATVLDALRAKYPQYRAQALETRPVIRIAIERARGWGSLA